MAQAIQKITLNVGRDIPFNKLVLSQQNVRKTKVGVSIEELAEDIERRGLLTSLNVRAELDVDGKETGIYRIPAGGRRYRALKLLVSRKKLSKTAGIPCIVSKSDTLEAEDSLAENSRRIDLHPLDEFRAIMTLREQGLDEEDIAARFHMSVATVKQRLRLASLSPRLLELYGNDELKLGQVMAFSITNDHVRQEQVWDTISRSHNQDAYYIRRMLTETAIRASDRRAIYVGLDAYEAAGGVVMRDLFEQDNGGWLQDPALLEQLVLEKLKADAEALQKSEGWKWVDAAIDFSYGHTSGLRRFYGEQAEFTEEELLRHDTLKAEYDKLDADYADETAEYSEEIERQLEDLGNQLDAMNDRPYLFDPDDVARGGVFISLGASGDLKIERGFVRPQDEPAVETAASENPDEEAGDGHAAMESSEGGVSINGRPADVETVEEEDDRVRPLSDRVIEDLTAARTVAMRNALANDPVMAFIAGLHVFVLKTFFAYGYGSDSCLEITLQSAKFGQTSGLGDTVWAKEIDQRHEAWGQDLPKTAGEVWDYLIALDDVSRQALFAHCVSLSLNAVVQPWNKRPAAIAHAGDLARSIGFDMVEVGWTPTVDNYLGRVTKAHILQAVTEAKGEQSAQLIGHLKKQDMAREAERLLTGSGWLPEPLRQASAETSAVPDLDEGTEVLESEQDEESVVELPAFLSENMETDDIGEDGSNFEEQHLDAAE